MTGPNLRSPYTREEWAAITAALEQARKRRGALSQAEQVQVVRETLRPMRSVGQLQMTYEEVG